MINKKGDLEIRFIVLGIIALVVLIIVLMIIYSASGKFGSSINTFWDSIMNMWKSVK